MRAIRIHRTGGVETLSLDEIATPQPKPNEVLVHVAAAGVNFIDVYHRTGMYPVPLPFTLGQESAGTVAAVGSEVSDLAVGDRVAYAFTPGSYAEYAAVPADRLVRVPESVDLHIAAAVMLQGMTAHYLACSTFPLQPGQTALVHAAAGGVGQLLCQIARQRGARVIGTVSTEEKAEVARSAGAHEVILYSREPIAARVRELTSGQGVEVVYDSVGKDTFEQSLDSLRPRGMLVLFGASSGAVPAFDLQVLNRKGSLFITRPSLGHYVADRQELQQRANDLFGWISTGSLRVHIDRELPLAEAGAAHQALESRATTGKVLLIP